MTRDHQLIAFLGVLATLVLLSIIGGLLGQPASESVLTGLIGLGGGFAIGKAVS